MDPLTLSLEEGLQLLEARGHKHKAVQTASPNERRAAKAALSKVAAKLVKLEEASEDAALSGGTGGGKGEKKKHIRPRSAYQMYLIGESCSIIYGVYCVQG